MDHPPIIPVNDEIFLREFSLDEADALQYLIDTERAYLRQWLDESILIDRPNQAASFIYDSSVRYDTNGSFDSGIWVRNQLAGVATIHPVNHEKRRTSIGYWLAREYQGAGVMTKSAIALVDFAFYYYRLKELRIRSAVNNQRSRALAERIGFKLEVIDPKWSKINGQRYDCAVYLMISETWSKLRDARTEQVGSASASGSQPG